MNMKEFVYGSYSYNYELIHQDRKTLSLTVRPDLGLVVKCPLHVQEDRVNLFLKRKWMWLNKQIRFFEKFKKTFYKREYVSGESFLYLGRQYQLIVKRSKRDEVSLLKGKLMVFTNNVVSDGKYNKKLIEDWYGKRATAIFQDRFDEVFKKFDYPKKPELVVRKMSKRWGSFLGDKKIILNPKLIQASKDCIDYVMTHELCHVKQKGHDKRFFRFLKSKMPDWERRKDQLEVRLG